MAEPLGQDESLSVVDRKTAIEKAPDIIQKIYALQSAGIIKDLDALGIKIDGVDYGEGMRSPNQIPVPREGVTLPDGSKVQVITEAALKDSHIETGEVAISAGFHDCTAVIWTHGEQGYFVHNSNSPPSNELKAHIISANDPSIPIGREGVVFEKIRKAVYDNNAESLITKPIFDQVIVIGRHPEEIAEFLKDSTHNLQTHIITINDGVSEGKDFDIWMSNNKGNIGWGVIPHIK